MPPTKECLPVDDGLCLVESIALVKVFSEIETALLDIDSRVRRLRFVIRPNGAMSALAARGAGAGQALMLPAQVPGVVHGELARGDA